MILKVAIFSRLILNEIYKFLFLLNKKRDVTDKMALKDPRFTTEYSADYNGTLYFRQNPQVVSIPAFALEEWCEPGYQPKQPNKGYTLTVNDYTFHNIKYGGGLWPNVVYTPFDSPN